MTDLLLTFNKGCATLKVAAYALASPALPLFRLVLELDSGIAQGSGRVPAALPAFEPRQDISDIVALITSHAAGPGQRLAAVAHRIVQGGDRRAPAWIDEALLEELEALEASCPLQQPPALEIACHLRELWPQLPQLAVFDSAFHRDQPALATTYALPAELRHQGIAAQGYHGISCQHVLHELRREHPALAAGRVLIAHLGHSASMTAVRDGRSVATSMGFSPLDGLPMATRCGQLDPGVLLYLLGQGWNRSRLTDLLYLQSGLLGLSGESADMRALLASPRDEARFAVEYFCYRAARMAASLACAMNGLDALVFTGGVGQHQAAVRERICAQLGWMGVAIDDEANRAGAEEISASGAGSRVLVLSADEEAEMSRQCQALLGPAPALP